MCKCKDVKTGNLDGFTISQLLGGGIIQGEEGIKATIVVRPDIGEDAVWRVPLVVLACVLLAAVAWFGTKKFFE